MKISSVLIKFFERLREGRGRGREKRMEEGGHKNQETEIFSNSQFHVEAEGKAVKKIHAQ